MRIRILSSVHFVITILLKNVVWKSILILFMTIKGQTLPQFMPLKFCIRHQHEKDINLFHLKEQMASLHENKDSLALLKEARPNLILTEFSLLYIL